MDSLQAPDVAPQGAAQAAMAQKGGEIRAVTLEAEHLPMPASHQAMMADVLHLLAAWAVRSARKARQLARERPQGPEAGAPPDLTSSQP